MLSRTPDITRCAKRLGPKMTVTPTPTPMTSPRDSSTDPFAGTRYRALERLASGVTGDLYAVEHVELGKRFAAKLLHAELVQDPRVVDRVRLEAQSLGRLRHPNIVAITGFDRTPQGQPFIVMELLRGVTLEDEISAIGVLPIAQALTWSRQLLSALAAVHQVGILHRNINPRNLFLHTTPIGERVLKLLDFGMARVLSGISDRAPRPLAVPTKTGTFWGMPEFTSPEAASGSAVDARSDIYQVGLVLYQMLTGRGPYDHLKRTTSEDHPAPLAQAHVTEAPHVPAGHLSGEVPIELDRIVLRALAKDPSDRFQSATEFCQELDAVATRAAPVETKRPERPGIPDSPALPRLDLDTSATRSRANLAASLRVLLFLALAALVAILTVAAGQRLAR
jgi:eukaryotic-like serine/threonine-protein kinase